MFSRIDLGALGATLLPLILVLCLGVVSSGCGGDEGPPRLYGDEDLEDFADPDLEPFTGDLDEMRARRLVRALVTPSPTDFFVDSGTIRGIQAEYLQNFVERLNRGTRDETKKIRIKYVPVPFAELLPALREGRGDIAAAFLTVTAERDEKVSFCAPFRRSVAEVVVSHRGSTKIEAIEDLAGERVYVLDGSSYAEHLRALNERFDTDDLDPVRIEHADPRLRSEDILELVDAGVLDLTVIDDYKAELWSQALPDIEVHEDVTVTRGNRVAWAVRESSPALRAEIDAFVREAREGALLGNILIQRYFGDVTRIEDPTAQAERDKLHRYLDLFRRYGERYGFDPLALAAQAYQESGLEHERRSPAGAVGLMQVLPTTAADPKVGIPDIDDPESNVHAGAKYLAFLRDRYFDDPELADWDRRAFSWAAYNAGPRKIREARGLARRMGLDPNVWFGNVEVATGRLLGREPVRYVANIHRYYIAYRLAWVQQEERRSLSRELR